MGPVTAATLIALALCLWGESVFPFIMDRRERVGHGARNLAVGLVNAVVIAFCFTGLIHSSIRWSELHQTGLLHRLDLPAGVNRWAGFLLFDLWMYGWHRANHGVPVLWRFHRMHHTDPALDTTSGIRFHVGEMVLSSLTRLAVIPLLGIALPDLLFYELVLQPVVLFHHSNINLPEALDRRMRRLVVSPNMHRVHHSDIPAETNSNYASVFSFWDRMLGTYCRRETQTIRFGLKEFRDPRWQTLPGLLTTPLA